VYFFLVTLAFGQVVNGLFAYFQDPFGGWYGIRCAATIRMTVRVNQDE
jgi:ABC-type branched-subunit amino acid transport system permease subunit